MRCPERKRRAPQARAVKLRRSVSGVILRRVAPKRSLSRRGSSPGYYETVEERNPVFHAETRRRGEPPRITEFLGLLVGLSVTAHRQQNSKEKEKEKKNK